MIDKPINFQDKNPNSHYPINRLSNKLGTRRTTTINDFNFCGCTIKLLQLKLKREVKSNFEYENS